MSSNTELPKDKVLAAQMINVQSKERGYLGYVFGTKEHAPTNIAGVAVFILSAMLAGLIFAPLPTEALRSGLITAVLSAFTFTLGLLFGQKSNSDS